MGKVLGRLAELFALIGGAVMLAIVLVTTTNTGAFLADRIARGFGGSVSALPGYEDFVRVSISCVALLFFPFCQLNRGHVSVDLFVSALPYRVRRGLDRLWLLVTAAIALFLAWWMVQGMLQQQADGVVTSVLSWPKWPFYAPGIASLVLWALIALYQTISEERHGDA
ncbi:MAG: TRAP transporter small permease [Neomegalonema sp.]|nr:TRAP transporter small permease [Neomegalonema sp.]